MLMRGTKSARNWKVGAAVLFMSVSGTSTAFAQIDEIIVTAQKREQSVQEVPITIAAVTGDFIDDAGIDDLLELQQFTPGLGVVTAASNVTTTIAIRGLGTTGGSIAFESGVGIYIDGVYRSRQSSAISDLVDLERVEVLKGPQGTLFGRNTISGAIQYISKAPDDELGGWLELQAGNLDHLNFKGAINVPIIEGKLATRVSGSISKRDGYVDNVFLGTEANERDRYQGKIQALFTPTENISFRLIGDYAKLDEVCCANGIFVETGAAFETAQLASGDILPATRFHNDEYSVNIDPSSVVEEWGVSGELNWDFGAANFTSITAYREFDTSTLVDADFSSVDIASSTASNNQWSFSQEIRFDGSVADRLDWLVGAYYYTQELEDVSSTLNGESAFLFQTGGFDVTLDQLVTLGGLTAFGIPAGVGSCAANLAPSLVPFCALPANPGGTGSLDFSRQEQSSWAIFGQGDVNITDNLIGTLGVRFNSESKELNADFGSTAPYPAFVRSAFITPIGDARDDVKYGDDSWSGTAKLSYFWTDDIMTFASYGLGYKAGGTNIDRLALDPTTALIASNQFLTTGTFDPETVETIVPVTFREEESKSWEIGMKSNLFDNRLRLNLALFRTKFDNLQLNQFDPTVNTFVIKNAASVISRGFEVDFQATPTDWLDLFGAYAYIDAYYDEFPGGACGIQDLPQTTGCDNTDRNAQGTPNNSVSASARVHREFFSNLVAYSQIDTTYTSERFYGTENDPRKTTGGFGLVNLRIGASVLEESVDVSFWGKNIFDEDYASVPLNSALPGSIVAGFTEPRTFGFTARGRF